MNQLYATIKTKFYQDGILQDVRCVLQTKMVAMMKGDNESKSLTPKPSVDTPTTLLLHQLIMDYFRWHGFHYSAQMFAQESACEDVQPLREYFEIVLGKFEDKSVPILLQLLGDQMGKNRHEQPSESAISSQPQPHVAL